jgi:[acyl-carrier-protein] S-malonyltransferase
MAVSMAAMAALQEAGGLTPKNGPSFVAGHSLGEYSALAAAGTFSLADAARLLRLRGQAMQEAVPPGDGAMLALLGAEIEQAERLAVAAAEASGFVCQIANDNAPGQVVLSGAKVAIDKAVQLAADHGVRKTVPLPVSAPFHCALMQPAAEKMAAALAEVPMRAPRYPVVTNVTASAVEDPATIRDLLVKQVTGVVRWRESVAYVAEQGVSVVFEVGAGRVLTGLARRIKSDLDARSIGTAAEIRAFAEWINA